MEAGRGGFTRPTGRGGRPAALYMFSICHNISTYSPRRKPASKFKLSKGALMLIMAICMSTHSHGNAI